MKNYAITFTYNDYVIHEFIAAPCADTAEAVAMYLHADMYPDYCDGVWEIDGYEVEFHTQRVPHEDLATLSKYVSFFNSDCDQARAFMQHSMGT